MNIAIIGTGISGLLTGYLLSQDHQITVFEANDYIGGHTHTVEVTRNHHIIPIDTGFIVFNDSSFSSSGRLLSRVSFQGLPPPVV